MKNLLTMLFIVLSINAIAQDVTTTSLRAMQQERKFSEMIAIEDSIYINLNCLSLKMWAYQFTGKNEIMASYSTTTLFTQEGTIREYCSALFKLNQFNKIINMGPIFKENMIPAFNPGIYHNSFYVQSAFRLGRYNLIIENDLYKYIDGLMPIWKSSVADQLIEQLFISYINASKIENKQPDFLESQYNKIKENNLIVHNELYKTLLSENYSIDVLVEWILSQLDSNEKEYILPYGSLMNITDKTSEDVAKIKYAVQSVAFSDKNDSVANAHLKLLQKLNISQN